MPRGKTASSLDLPLPAMLLEAGNRSKRDCIADAIRDAISAGLLAAHSPLPSSRTLAERWHVSRGTVETAFDRLCSEGYITRTQGSGTCVSAVIPEDFLLRSATQRQRAGDPRQASADTSVKAAPPVLEERPLQAGVPFTARMASPDLLKLSQWNKHVADAVRDSRAVDANLMPMRGLLELRQQIAAYLGAFRGLSCRAEDIFITSGIRHAIDAVARVLISPGNKVVIEDPGYPGAYGIFGLSGAEIVHVAVDEHGMKVSDLGSHEDVSLVYTTPAHQSPLGVTMSPERREQLLSWADQHRAWVLEDDYDGEFNFDSAPLPALKSQDRRQRVIYCGSFNKTVAAHLRVGFMVLPPALQERMLGLWEIVGLPVSGTTQMALAAFMASGNFSSHMRRCRETYRQRRDVLIRELEHHAPGRFDISGSHAGFHFVLWPRNASDPSISEQEIIDRAASEGIALQPLSSLCRQVSFGPAFIIGYSALSLAQARFSGRKLGEILDGQKKASAPAAINAS